MTRFLLLHPDDNVATALADVPAGEPVELDGQLRTITREPICFEHKVALCDIPEGKEIIKYGVPIGVTYCAVHAGEHVHLHNLRSLMIERQDGENTSWSNRG